MTNVETSQPAIVGPDRLYAEPVGSVSIGISTLCHPYFREFAAFREFADCLCQCFRERLSS